MSNDTLSSLTKSKLSLNSLSLHRWVLLKNSIQHHHHPTEPTPIDDDDEPVAKAAAVVVAAAAAATVAAQAEAEAQAAAFMFPDAGRFLGANDAQMREAQWLDELLESLGEEDDDEDEESSDDDEDRPSLNAVEDDVDYTPLVSPVSSLDDLSNSTHHHHHHHPHYNYSFQDDALPYYDAEEEEDYTMASVPDAIDDTSDDETCSDAPTTPSLGRSSNSFMLPPHPPPGGHPHPLSETRTHHDSHPHSRPTPPPTTTTTTTTSTMTRPRHHPRVYAVDDSDSPIHNSYFYSRQTIDEPWPVDPLPFPLTHAYQQC